jgi:hypothetical protein
LFPSIDVKKLVRYLRLLGKKILYAKAGWLLSRYKKQWSIPDTVLSSLHGQLSARTFYLHDLNGKGNYRYNDEWNLMIPAHLQTDSDDAGGR